jgi:hypothetical protein
LLTGLYNHQAGIGKMTDAEDEPGYRGHLTENTVTLAEVLKVGWLSNRYGRQVARFQYQRSEKSRRSNWPG